MAPVTIIIPGTGTIIIHGRLPGDLVSTGIHEQDGDFRLVSVMVGSVGGSTPIGDGGGRVVIVMDIGMVIVVVTGTVPGPVTEQATGQGNEMHPAMSIATGVQVLNTQLM